MLSPKSSPIGQLLSQYVCVRLIRNDDADIALFERDWNNTLFYFAMNADERIYLRYGGRDPRDPLYYLNMDSLKIALERGLELHRKNQAGALPGFERPKPASPRDIPPLVERTFARGQCVECHLIGDYQLVYKEEQGKLDKMRDMYRWPNIRNLGLNLDVPKGLVLKETSGAAEKAGLHAGDEITAVDRTPVYTYADLQFALDRVDRMANQVVISVKRSGEGAMLPLELPARWWVTDLTYRHYSVDPRPEFTTRPLTAEEKQQFGVQRESFAAKITGIGGFAEMLKVHELKTGDVILAVDGAATDPVADSPELYIKLRKRAGDTIQLDILRDGQRLRLPVRTQRFAFRK